MKGEYGIHEASYFILCYIYIQLSIVLDVKVKDEKVVSAFNSEHEGGV